MRFSLLILALLLGASAFAAGQAPQAFGVTPPSLAVADAQPGQSYVRYVDVQNQVDSAGPVRVETQGDGGPWVSTVPASGFVMAARSAQRVEVTIAVPGNAGPGNHSFLLRFVREGASGPSGSGATVDYAAAVRVDVTVGGQPVERITYLSARIDNVTPLGQPVHAYVLARNDGNVQATAQAHGTVLPFASDQPAGPSANGSLVLSPGQQGEVTLTFPSDLPAGQYRARLEAAGFNATLPFKVASGETAPDGVLRAILHAPRGHVGEPLRISAWFHNTGNVTINSAVFQAKVRDGDLVLATLESDPAAVEAGQSVNLTVTWTPGKAGVVRLIGLVEYDGYVTLPADDTITVDPAAGGFPWWILLVALAIAVVVGVWAWRSNRSRPPRARP